MSELRLSRRALLLLGVALTGPAFGAGKPKPGGDNGIGGTGYAPTDRGIGGTGFIGVIRKFGSVYVNGARIAYAPDAEVVIDGAPAQISDLRLGQSTRIVATPAGKDFATRRIEVVSEAVGRVERIAGRQAVVLGQNVILPSRAIARQIKSGDRLAISGLRRPDQTILATAVERREGVRDQIAGLLTRDGDGRLRIGGATVAGVDPALAGGRVRVVGAREGDAFVATQASPDGPAALGGLPKYSIETFVVAQDQGKVTTASGLRVENLGGAGLAEPRLVVMTGALNANHAFVAEHVATVTPGGGFEPPPRGGFGGGFGGGGPGGFGGGPAGGGGPGLPHGGGPSGGSLGGPHGGGHLGGGSGGPSLGGGHMGSGVPGSTGGVLPTPGGLGSGLGGGFGGGSGGVPGLGGAAGGAPGHLGGATGGAPAGVGGAPGFGADAPGMGLPGGVGATPGAIVTPGATPSFGGFFRGR